MNWLETGQNDARLLFAKSTTPATTEINPGGIFKYKRETGGSAEGTSKNRIIYITNNDGWYGEFYLDTTGKAGPLNIPADLDDDSEVTIFYRVSGTYQLTITIGKLKESTTKTLVY